MSGRQLFRTPIAIGMLCGALAGGLGMLLQLVNLRGLMQSGLFFQYIIGFELLQLTLLTALPARIALGHWRFFIKLEAILLALVFGTYVPPSLLLSGTGSFNNYVFMCAWLVLTTLASGAILGRTLAVAYNRPELLRAGTRWGALGSLARITVILSAMLHGRTGQESTAMIAMLSALAFVVQGVVAAVPFERARTLNCDSE